MRQVLITGGTCYVGRALIAALVDRGLTPHVLVRPGSDRTRFDALPRLPVFHVHDGSTAGLARIARTIQADIAFHLAGLYRRIHTPEDVDRLLDANVVFGTRLLEALRDAGTRRLVNVASCHQYLDGGAYRPFNLYAATKEAFEAILAYYRDAGHLDATTLVLFDTYGPGDWRPKLMAAIRGALATGTPLPLPASDLPMDMAHVDDVVSALLHAADLLERDAPAVNGRRFAVTSGDRRSIEGIVKVFEKVAGKPVQRQWGAYPMPDREITRLWDGPLLPGWTPGVTLEDGIRRFLNADTNG